MDRTTLILLAGLLVASGCDAADRTPARTDCVAPEGLGRPTTVDEAIALAEALPEDADPACLIRSLERPLEVVATDSVLSAQPAASTHRPRLFVLIDDFVLSVVPAGEGRKLVEFGERTGPKTSLKAEIKMPLAEGFIPSDAYDRVQFDETASKCGLCHREEALLDRRDGVPRYVSDVLRPYPETLVAVDLLRGLRATCTPGDRGCDMLRALFDHGEVRQAAFSEALPVLE